jgi:hypothetical protein
MAENTFLNNPLKIIHYDLINKDIKKVYTLLGNIPKAVKNAVMNPKGGNIKVLEKFYGKRWKTVLGQNIITGGEEETDISFEDVDISFEDIDLTIPVKEKEVVKVPSETKNKIEYVDLGVFPEDSWADLRDIVYTITDISPYRQHLFYSDKIKIRIPYQVSLDNSPVFIDITNNKIFPDVILDIHVDKLMEDLKETILIENFEPFKLLGNFIYADHTIYLVDFNDVIMSKSPHFAKILEDEIQFNLLYYGFVIKYWPIISPTIFKKILLEEPLPEYLFPHAIKLKIQKQRELIDSTYSGINSILRQDNKLFNISIIEATVNVSNNIRINLRNLFDKLKTDKFMPVVQFKYKDKYIEKRHVYWGRDLKIPIVYTATDYVLVVLEKCRVVFYASGKYNINFKWKEDYNINFADAIKLSKISVEPLLKNIEKLGRLVLNILPNQFLIRPDKTSHLTNITAIINWNKIVNTTTFNAFKNLWKQEYESCNIISTKFIGQMFIFAFYFKKGLISFTPHEIIRIFGESNINQFDYISNPELEAKFNYIFRGRLIKIHHKIINIKIEISNVQSEEFNIIRNYLLVFLHNNMREVKSEQLAKISSTDKKLHLLLERDPELFDLKRHDPKSKLYTVLCQQPKQPIIYTEEEYKSMSKKDQEGIIKYHNFTFDSPAYYKCPSGKYPYLSFRNDVHPLNYCLPCCKKKKLIPGSKKEKVYNLCLNHHIVHEDMVEKEDIPITHVLEYKKLLNVGRQSLIPGGIISDLLFSTIEDSNTSYHLVGVPQHGYSVDNLGILFSIAKILDMSAQDLLNYWADNVNYDVFKLIGNLDLITNIKDFKYNLRNLITADKPTEDILLVDWDNVFIELAGYVSNINIAVVHHRENKFSLKSNYKFQEYDMGIIITHEDSYPLALVDKNISLPDNIITLRFILSNPLNSLISGLVKNKIEQYSSHLPNITLLKDFIKKNSKYNFDTFLTNNQNVIYGVILAVSPNNKVYVPLDYQLGFVIEQQLGYEIKTKNSIAAEYDLPHPIGTKENPSGKIAKNGYASN